MIFLQNYWQIVLTILHIGQQFHVVHACWNIDNLCNIVRYCMKLEIAILLCAGFSSFPIPFGEQPKHSTIYYWYSKISTHLYAVQFIFAFCNSTQSPLWSKQFSNQEAVKESINNYVSLTENLVLNIQVHVKKNNILHLTRLCTFHFFCP